MEKHRNRVDRTHRDQHNTEGEKVAKTFEKYSKEEASLAECNDRALNALFGAVDSSQYRLISNCIEVKKAWEILETTHKGDERVKTAKLQILMTKYENLRMDGKEKIAEFHGRVRELANEAENLKRPFTEDNLVLKLMGNLETIELQMNEEIKQKKSVKQIAFHSHATGGEEEDDEDPSDGDYQEHLSLITKQFKKNPRPKESRSPTDDSKRRGPQCFECGGFGHIQSKCANNLKKKRQAFVSTWSDEENDSKEVLGNNNCAFTTQIHDEDPDSLTNQLVALQEELDNLCRKLDETMQQLEQVEGEKANLNYELTQLKSYQKWMKSAGAEQIENLVDKSRFYGDRTGIGHTLRESSKTPLDLFVTRSKIADEELKEYSRDKKWFSLLTIMAKLRAKISQEDEGSPSLNLNPEIEIAIGQEEVQRELEDGGPLNEEQDEAPLFPDLPTIMLLEYKPSVPLEEQPQVAEVDEEFQTLLDEEPMVAVSEVPFKKTENQDRKSSTSICVTTTAKSYLPAIMKKNILPQRNIELEDFALKTTPIPLLDARNLLKSVTLPGSYVKQVIHEFYCNLSEDFVNRVATSLEKVFVRGKLYTFSSTSVNKFLGLDDDQDALVSEVTMWKELTHGTIKGQHPSNKVPLSILNSSYSILLRVAACHLLATSHTNTVTKAMGMLLYKIKNNVPVNLGKLIVAQISEFGKHNYKNNDNGVLKYQEHKLKQNKEALLLVDQQRRALEEERRSLIWLQEHTAQSAQEEGTSS
ncbi:unnamed protein product [Cuscuta campestris]|uniref:CCHC-type domain-containing protein n=1 Tax=Cuscuta campestris TaxID=132261 RepID=A0A484MP18_9ASTE|nr:unnamed protein product [Cuscuta campestris]